MELQAAQQEALNGENRSGDVSWGPLCPVAHIYSCVLITWMALPRESGRAQSHVAPRCIPELPLSSVEGGDLFVGVIINS